MFQDCLYSGFGRNHYAIAGKSAVFITKSFSKAILPRAWATATERFRRKLILRRLLQLRAIYNNTKIEKLRVDVIRLVIEGRQRSVVCYPNVSLWGWCSVDESVSHDDFDHDAHVGVLAKSIVTSALTGPGSFQLYDGPRNLLLGQTNLLPEHKCSTFSME